VFRKVVYMVKRAALVLAGGKACRFQNPYMGWQDKALVLLENKPFLVHVIENVSSVVDEVIVCVNNNDKERIEGYRRVFAEYRLSAKIVLDESLEVGGPMRAILSGLRVANADYCLIVPCDMPFINASVVEHLFSLSKGFDVVMPMWPNGRLETLCMVLERLGSLEIVQILCQLKRSHVDDIPRAAAKVFLPSTVKTLKTFDPQLKSFININSPEDLEKMSLRDTEGSIKEDVIFFREKSLLTDLLYMREAVKLYQENHFVEAQEKFETCKKQFEACNNFFWTALTCECKAMVLLSQLQLQENSNQQIGTQCNFKILETFVDAANNYDNETKIYDQKGCIRLFERALADKIRCSQLQSN